MTFLIISSLISHANENSGKNWIFQNRIWFNKNYERYDWYFDLLIRILSQVSYQIHFIFFSFPFKSQYLFHQIYIFLVWNKINRRYQEIFKIITIDWICENLRISHLKLWLFVISFSFIDWLIEFSLLLFLKINL